MNLSILADVSALSNINISTLAPIYETTLIIFCQTIQTRETNDSKFTSQILAALAIGTRTDFLALPQYPTATHPSSTTRQKWPPCRRARLCAKSLEYYL
jgi:hypothetical protein